MHTATIHTLLRDTEPMRAESSSKKPAISYLGFKICESHVLESMRLLCEKIGEGIRQDEGRNAVLPRTKFKHVNLWAARVGYDRSSNSRKPSTNLPR